MRPADFPPETTPRWQQAARSRAPLYLIGAMLLALLAAVLTYQYLQQIREQSLPTAQAVVVVSEVPAQTVLTADLVEIRQLPSAMLPEGAIKQEGLAVGRLTRYPLATGEVLLQHDLMSEEGAGLAGRLPDGRWAMVMPVGWLASPLPQIEQGDHIDILAYAPGQAAEQTALIVERVELVEVHESGGGAARVTLAVSLEQATSILYSHVNGFQMVGLLKAIGD